MSNDASLPVPMQTAADPTRRDFLFLATAAVGVVGAAATLWPLIDQMNPDASTVAAGQAVDVGISPIQPGQQVVVVCRSKPVFIVNRPKAALDGLQDPQLVARLSDPDSAERQ